MAGDIGMWWNMIGWALITKLVIECGFTSIMCYLVHRKSKKGL